MRETVKLESTDCRKTRRIVHYNYKLKVTSRVSVCFWFPLIR